MVWSCVACTFENRNDDAKYCEICQTFRRGNNNKAATSAAAVSSSSATTAVTTGADAKGNRSDNETTNKNSNKTKSVHQQQQMTLFGTKAVEVVDLTTASFSEATTTKSTKERKKTHNNDDTRPPTKIQKKKESSSSSRPSSSASSSRKRKVPSSLSSSTAQSSSSAAVAAPSSASTTTTPPPLIKQHLCVRRNNIVSYETLWNESQTILKTNFNIDKLRNNIQPKAIQTCLERKSQIIVMNTGGGKSLCYQLPATVLGGITFVISPLIALMLDQVSYLNTKCGIPSEIYSSSIQKTKQQQQSIINRLLLLKDGDDGDDNNKKKKMKVSDTNTTSSGGRQTKLTDDRNNMSDSSSTSNKGVKPITLLYITPESLKTEQFRTVLSTLYKQDRIAMFAIDEAHCLSRYVRYVVCRKQFVLIVVLKTVLTQYCVVTNLLPPRYYSTVGVMIFVQHIDN